MKPPHLLRIEEEAERFAPLLAAARLAGLRVGWLDLVTPVAAPAELAPAAAAGALRAVAAPAGCTVVVKLRRGAPVLRDLLREHFLGCALVLVRAGVESFIGPGAPPGLAAPPPRLRPAGDGWHVEPVDAAPRHFTAEQLAAALRRARPWSA